MLDESSFKKYLQIKSLIKVNENLEFEKVLAGEILKVVYNDDRSNFESWVRILLNFITTYNCYDIKVKFDKSRLLATSFIKRSDYTELVSLSTEGIKGALYMPLYTLKKKPVLNLRNITSSIKLIFKAFDKDESFFKKIYVASNLTFYRNVHNELKDQFMHFDFAGKKYLSFNGSYSFENLLTQFFNSKNVETFTLSHGISYIKFKRQLPRDAINGENLVSQKVFVWGESSKNDLVVNYGIDEQKIFVAGNPKYRAKKIDVKQSFKKGIILLGRFIYDRGNNEILKIASLLKRKYKINFEVKLHPSLDVIVYTNTIKELGLELVDNNLKITDCFASNDFDFAIANNTTAYYEAMYFNNICFRYGPDENEIFEGLDDKFKNESTLLYKIDLFKNLEKEFLNKFVESLLIRTLGMGINNYKSYLSE